MFCFKCKMNEIVNNFLLVGDKFMPEIHLKQPGFTCSAYGPFSKNKERIGKFLQTGNTDFIYKNELDKSCFQYDMVYGKLKDLSKRAHSDKVLKDKAFKIASDPEYDVYQRGLASMGYKFFNKKSSGSVIANEPDYQLADELNKKIIRKFKKRKLYSSFRDNIWGANLADMQSLSKYNNGIKYLLCAIDLFSKYAWIVPLKDKKGISIVNAFQQIILEGRKPNKIWVNQSGEFYNNLFKRFLKINNTEMYSMYVEGKSVVAERFIRTLKSKILKHMTTVSKNVYFDVLDGIVSKYNNTVHRSIKMKPIDVKSDSYAEYNEDSNEKDPKFKVGDHVRISKYKNIFHNWSEAFVVTKIKNTVPWTYVISDLNDEPITGSFYEKELQKTSLEKFRIEKVLKKR